MLVPSLCLIKISTNHKISLLPRNSNNIHKNKYKNNTCQVINIITQETVVSAKTITYKIKYLPSLEKTFLTSQKKAVTFKGKSSMTN